jgi:hypothetical protein
MRASYHQSKHPAGKRILAEIGRTVQATGTGVNPAGSQTITLNTLPTYGLSPITLTATAGGMLRLE